MAPVQFVKTFNFNKAVKRNITRFPEYFMFQLSREEFNNLKFQFGISSWGIEITLKLLSNTQDELIGNKWFDKNGNYKKKTKDWRNKKTTDDFFKAIKELDEDNFHLSELKKKQLVEELYKRKYFCIIW